MLKQNPILTTIDYEQEGKQTGYLRLPHSVHRSAYGWLPFPVACIRNGEGPTALLLSGTHGDEFEGQDCGQVFLHYNNKEGKFLEANAFDGRPMLGLPSYYKSNG